jgi:hypothetical protein
VKDSPNALADVSLNYRLVPDQKDQWTIFVSSDTAVRTGTLEFIGNKIKIEIIDLSSGKVSEQFNLSLQSK